MQWPLSLPGSCWHCVRAKDVPHIPQPWNSCINQSEDPWGAEQWEMATRHACFLPVCPLAWLGVSRTVGRSPLHTQGPLALRCLALPFFPLAWRWEQCDRPAALALLPAPCLACPLCFPLYRESISWSTAERLQLERPSESLANWLQWCPCQSPSLELQPVDTRCVFLTISQKLLLLVWNDALSLHPHPISTPWP